MLLIIFMVAAPLSTVDLPIDLPSSTATPQKKPDKPTYVSIKPDLAVAIGETPVKRVDLVRSLDAMADAGKDRFIFLRADRAVPYGELMDVLEICAPGAIRRSSWWRWKAFRTRPPPALKSETLRSGATSRCPSLDIEQKSSRRLWIFAASARLRFTSAARRWRSRISAATISMIPSVRRRSRSGWK